MNLTQKEEKITMVKVLEENKFLRERISELEDKLSSYFCSSCFTDLHQINDYCVPHNTAVCGKCDGFACDDCSYYCEYCEGVICNSCMISCDVCDSYMCDNCITSCEKCELNICKSCPKHQCS